MRKLLRRFARWAERRRLGRAHIPTDFADTVRDAIGPVRSGRSGMAGGPTSAAYDRIAEAEDRYVKSFKRPRS